MTTRIVFVCPQMCFAVLLCLSLTYLIRVCHTSSTSTEESTNRYECGPHGKFEYCIDGIPGCVIGCHCHPGYYFDTETKICEPNTKLAQDFRRRYMAEPTRVYPVSTPPVVDYTPTPTTTSALNEKVDEVAKDTDDIGDWLFNQFFKTIETQVINNTTDEQTPSRRSGLDVYRPKNEAKKHGGGHKRDNPDTKNMKSKARKSLKGRGKKKKSKVHGLRRKLLRITEDDSLFDSDSDEDSSGGGSSDSSSSGSSSRSCEASKEKNKESNGDKNDREHGHKKVIIFNRRPRPPLPSFIFLPSMDTPYYPPIGLPPPPVLPMFPMVPVPPMAPYFPFLEIKNGSSTTTSASKDTTTTGGETTTAASDTTATDTSDTPGAEEAPKHSDRRTRPKGHRSRIPIATTMSSEETFLIRSRDIPPPIPTTSKHAERVKLMHKLRQKLKKKNKVAPIQDNVVIAPEDDTPLLDVTRKQSRHTPRNEDDDILNDVNFKYITELIHRANLSESDLPLVPSNTKPTQSNSKLLKNIHHSRRNYIDPLMSNLLYQDETTTHSNVHVQKPEDAYFSTLGRQIASLVRNVASQMNNNVVKEQINRKELVQPILQENSYAPRSYWERTARSPLTRFKNYFDRLHFDRQSDEKNLFSLEDEVKTLATTSPPLSLHELENILSTLQKAQNEMQKTKQSADQSNDSLNVNLLPNKTGKTEISSRKFDNPLDYVEYFPRTKHMPSTNNVSQNFTNSNAAHYLDPSNLDSPMIDDWMFNSRDYKQTINSNQQTITNTTFEHDISKYIQNKLPVPLYKKIKKQNEYLRNHSNKPVSAHNIAWNAEPTAKYNEVPVNYPVLHAKYPEQQPPRQPEQTVKQPEQTVRYPEQTVKYPDQTVRYPEWSAKYAEMIAKYPEMYAKYRELIAKYPNLPAKYPELVARYPEVHSAHSTSPQKYPEMPVKYAMQPVNYQSNPSVVNYFSDGENKRHYTIEASYPVHIPNYRRGFSKRFENEPGKQSYFHHELHHFDYID